MYCRENHVISKLQYKEKLYKKIEDTLQDLKMF